MNKAKGWKEGKKERMKEGKKVLRKKDEVGVYTRTDGWKEERMEAGKEIRNDQRE